MECIAYACTDETITGLFSAYLSISVYGVVIAAAIYSIIWCDKEVFWILVGALFNFLLNIILKLLVAADRPNSSCGIGPGFPSGHAQTVAYAAGFLTLRFLYAKISVIYFWYRIIIIYGIVAAVSASRFYLYAHTITQIIAGIIIGAIMGTAMYVLMYRILFLQKRSMGGYYKTVTV